MRALNEQESEGSLVGNCHERVMSRGMLDITITECWDGASLRCSRTSSSSLSQKGKATLFTQLNKCRKLK